MDSREGDPQRQARQAGARAYVDEVGRHCRIENAGVTQGTAEGDCLDDVATVDICRIAQGGEVETGAGVENGIAVAGERVELS